MLAGLFDIALDLVDAWAQKYALSEPPSAEAAANLQEIPRWVDALLLCLDIGMQPAPKTQPEQAQTSSTAASAPAAAPTPAAPAVAEASTAPSPAQASAPEGSGKSASPAAADASAAASAAGQPESNKQEPAPQKSAEERQQAATKMLRDSINSMFLPNGLLNQQQHEQAASICMRLLQHLHAWGSKWQIPEAPDNDNEAILRPQPASSTQAVVQVLARATKTHKIALKVCMTLIPCVDTLHISSALCHTQPFDC